MNRLRSAAARKSAGAMRPAPDTPEELYLDIVKRGLTDWLYDRFDPRRREIGGDYPWHAHTLIGLRRLDNIQRCMERALQDDVPGDFIETGVWRGGATIFMRAVLKAYRVTDRLVWAADSFEGLPPPDEEKYPKDRGSRWHEHEVLKVDISDVEANFERYGLLDDQVQFLKGWFKDTLPAAPIESLAVARLDGDMYESTMDALVNLYPRVSPGGFVIIDDYLKVRACRQAVKDFRKKHGVREKLEVVDRDAVFWRRAG